MTIDSPPYSQLALYYDKIMNHVDYKKWAKFIKTVLLHYNKKPKNIVELACGTGAIFEYLKSDKWLLFGGDQSYSMLQMANRKKAKIPCNYFCANFCFVPVRKECFDVVLILYDSVNYIIDDADITHMFKEMNRILKKLFHVTISR